MSSWNTTSEVSGRSLRPHGHQRLPLRRRGVRGFTLVEMMVVITIIAILAALLIPTIGMALRGGKNGAMAMELKELAQAIEAYAKDHNNDYPPDFTSREGLVAHFRKAFPRSKFNPAPWIANTGAPAATRDARNLDPAEALVFWLSLTRNNPRDPFTGTGEFKVYFTFDPARLVDLDSDGWPEFVPKHGLSAPYVYFDGRILNSPATATGGSMSPTCHFAFARYPSRYNATSPMALATPTIFRDVAAIPSAMSGATDNVVRPYRSNQLAAQAPPGGSEVKTWPNDRGVTDLNNTLWIGPGKFQIVCAGMDGQFGHDNMPQANVLAFKQFPNPNYYTNGPRDLDEDNLADFGEGQTFGDAVP